MSEEQNSAPLFRVGQKVVCVDDVPSNNYNNRNSGYIVSGDLDGLQRGRVYTVRALGPWGPEEPTGNVWLVEIVRESDTHYSLKFGEPPFGAGRFRPAIDRKTDISIFTAMLNPSRKKVTA